MAPKNSLPVTFLIVPGSFATAGLYASLVAYLESKGHSARAVDLPSANDGSRPGPPPNMEDDVRHIRAAALEILDHPTAPRNVILAPHSYSGFPTTSAVEGLTRAERSAASPAAKGKGEEGDDKDVTAVLGIVYMASFIAQLGQSPRSLLGDEFGMMPEPVRSGIPGQYFPALGAEYAGATFSDVAHDEREIARLAGLMTCHSSDAFSGRLTYEAWRHVDCVTIIPEHDVILPVAVQEELYRRAREKGARLERVFLQGMAHGVPATRPELVAAVMIGLAEKVAGGGV
ncbi:alpha/beta-hydrolase [Xylariomycetidae sp. FL2044]|nr:alpha/beta-hydrolase [Xylariomycetidae sp. FL2044]